MTGRYYPIHNRAMLYTTNTKLHTAHTVREGSPTHAKILATNASHIRIGGVLHKVYTDRAAAVADLALLVLGGAGE